MPLHQRPTYYTKSAVIDVPALPFRCAGVVRESIVDGPGLRYVVFTQGCPHHCPGCHNPETHDPEGGTMTSARIVWEDLQKCRRLLKGVTFSGGEPFLWGHELAAIGRAAKAAGLNVMTYSGYTWEQLQQKAETEPGVEELLSVTDYLVDGPFIMAKRDLTLQFRGSSNQRILNISDYPHSRKAFEVDRF